MAVRAGAGLATSAEEPAKNGSVSLSGVVDMGSFSLMHWIVVLAIILILFGAGKLPRVMGDFAKGIKAFKAGMKEEDEEAETPAAPPRCRLLRLLPRRLPALLNARASPPRPSRSTETVRACRGCAMRRRANPSCPPLIDRVEIRTSHGRGRGVFARVAIAPGTLIEAAPVIILPAADCPALDRTIIYDYYFHWDGDPDGEGRGALGARRGHPVQSFEPAARPCRSQLPPADPRSDRHRSDRARRGGDNRLWLHPVVRAARIVGAGVQPAWFEGGEEAGRNFHALRRRRLRRDEAGDVSCCNKGSNEGRVARQHVDRHGPLSKLASDDCRRLVVAEQDDQSAAVYPFGEPVAEHGEIILQALQIAGRQRGPVGLAIIPPRPLPAHSQKPRNPSNRRDKAAPAKTGCGSTRAQSE